MALRDGCPLDPSKIEPGLCGCGSPDVDSDGDGALDCNDQCPNDPAKTTPGQCGCGNLETDTDSDGTADCNDQCPTDPTKTEPGQCGCGNPDTDTDGDGTADCNDQCPDLAALTAPVTYHADVDGDGFGALLDTAAFCAVAAPSGYTTDSTDCDDATVLYLDGDADTFGSTTKVACAGVLSSTDCDDVAADVYPGAAELCANDGVDNNCNGEAALDSESTDVLSFFVDGDQDGFGTGAAILSCTPVAGATLDNTDCDDAAVMYLDGDADTFGSTTKVACAGVATSDDCNDAAADVYPGALENCANIAVDNDCDLDVTDLEATDSVAYYRDADADGFGAGAATMSCAPIAGSVTDNTDCDDLKVYYADVDQDGFAGDTMVACGFIRQNDDCNDNDPLVNPDAVETCANIDVDNDCNGSVGADEAIDALDYHIDADGDGFGAGARIQSCVPMQLSLIHI